MAKPKSNKQVNFRSAKSGRYVTPQYAKRYPATTVRETGPKPSRKK